MEKKEIKIPKPFIVATLVAAMAIFVIALVRGNEPLVSPNYTQYEAELRENLIPSDWLANTIMRGESLYRVVGMRNASECVEQKEMTTSFDCYDRSKLSDSGWIRSEFGEISEPLIIFGTETADGLKSASILKYWRYSDVKVLEGGFNDFSLQYLKPEFADINIGEANSNELRQLATYRFFSASDPLIRKKGESLALARQKHSGGDEEYAGVEEGGDDAAISFDALPAAEGC